jgi:hypothetical protein
VPLPGGGEDLTLDRPEELELNPKYYFLYSFYVVHYHFLILAFTIGI